MLPGAEAEDPSTPAMVEPGLQVHLPISVLAAVFCFRWEACVEAEHQLYSRMDLAIVVLGVHDDHQVGGHIHTPAETPRRHHHLDSP